jgi:predicted transcriptional regulator of viral defense system
MTKTLTRSTLWEIAVEQHGFVTAAQARDEGINQAAVTMLVRRGKLERAAWGVYRFPEIPPTQYDRYMLAVLRTGVPEAALSHETALDCYGISDINPNLIHVAVNLNRRIRRQGNEDYVIHYEPLTQNQVGWWQKIPTVKPAVAIAQCIDYGTPTHLLNQSIESGQKHGYLKTAEAEELRKRLEIRYAQ